MTDIDPPDVCEDCEYSYPECGCEPDECKEDIAEFCYEGRREV